MERENYDTTNTSSIILFSSENKHTKLILFLFHGKRRKSDKRHAMWLVRWWRDLTHLPTSSNYYHILISSDKFRNKLGIKGKKINIFRSLFTWKLSLNERNNAKKRRWRHWSHWVVECSLRLIFLIRKLSK